MSESEWEEIGSFGVDSGTFMICDPCYLEYRKNVKQMILARNQMIGDEQREANIVFPKSEHEGLGFIGDTQLGDGLFFIYKRINKEGFKEIKIVFEP